MADFIPTTVWTCETNQHYETVVTGGMGKKYHVSLSPHNPGLFSNNWACDCPHFQHRLRGSDTECKHILEAQKSHCGWNASLEPTAEPTKDKDGKLHCPVCGGDVIPVMIAI